MIAVDNNSLWCVYLPDVKIGTHVSAELQFQALVE